MYDMLVRRAPVPTETLRLEHVVTWFQRGDAQDHRAPISASVYTLSQGCSIAICTYKRAESLDRLLDSLLGQTPKPDQLIIVDASPDDVTEQIIKQRPDIEALADEILYFRVFGPLKGLTHQRNFALRWVRSDLVVFFDDDVVLLPRCLFHMQQVHRSRESQVVGVGAFVHNQSKSWTFTLLWYLYRLLLIVPNLDPGKYHRSSFVTPLCYLTPTQELEGDVLSGCAMMWKTQVARELGFADLLEGYAFGEDLDFALRARRKGKLVLLGAARVLHLHESSGRPDSFRSGYMEIYNSYLIHRRAFSDRAWQDTAWYIYARLADTLFLGRHLLIPSRWSSTLRRVAGRAKATYDIIRQH